MVKEDDNSIKMQALEALKQERKKRQEACSKEINDILTKYNCVLNAYFIAQAQSFEVVPKD